MRSGGHEPAGELPSFLRVSAALAATLGKVDNTHWKYVY